MAGCSANWGNDGDLLDRAGKTLGKATESRLMQWMYR